MDSSVHLEDRNVHHEEAGMENSSEVMDNRSADPNNEDQTYMKPGSDYNFQEDEQNEENQDQVSDLNSCVSEDPEPHYGSDFHDNSSSLSDCDDSIASHNFGHPAELDPPLPNIDESAQNSPELENFEGDCSNSINIEHHCTESTNTAAKEEFSIDPTNNCNVEENLIADKDKFVKDELLIVADNDDNNKVADTSEALLEDNEEHNVTPSTSDVSCLRDASSSSGDEAVDYSSAFPSNEKTSPATSLEGTENRSTNLSSRLLQAVQDNILNSAKFCPPDLPLPAAEPVGNNDNANDSNITSGDAPSVSSQASFSAGQSEIDCAEAVSPIKLQVRKLRNRTVTVKSRSVKPRRPKSLLNECDQLSVSLMEQNSCPAHIDSNPASFAGQTNSAALSCMSPLSVSLPPSFDYEESPSTTLCLTTTSPDEIPSQSQLSGITSNETLSHESKSQGSSNFNLNLSTNKTTQAKDQIDAVNSQNEGRCDTVCNDTNNKVEMVVEKSSVLPCNSSNMEDIDDECNTDNKPPHTNPETCLSTLSAGSNASLRKSSNRRLKDEDSEDSLPFDFMDQYSSNIKEGGSNFRNRVMKRVAAKRRASRTNLLSDDESIDEPLKKIPNVSFEEFTDDLPEIEAHPSADVKPTVGHEGKNESLASTDDRTSNSAVPVQSPSKMESLPGTSQSKVEVMDEVDSTCLASSVDVSLQGSSNRSFSVAGSSRDTESQTLLRHQANYLRYKRRIADYDRRLREQFDEDSSQQDSDDQDRHRSDRERWLEKKAILNEKIEFLIKVNGGAFNMSADVDCGEDSDVELPSLYPESARDVVASRHNEVNPVSSSQGGDSDDEIIVDQDDSSPSVRRGKGSGFGFPRRRSRLWSRKRKGEDADVVDLTNDVESDTNDDVEVLQHNKPVEFLKEESRRKRRRTKRRLSQSSAPQTIDLSTATETSDPPRPLDFSDPNLLFGTLLEQPDRFIVPRDPPTAPPLPNGPSAPDGPTLLAAAGPLNLTVASSSDGGAMWSGHDRPRRAPPHMTDKAAAMEEIFRMMDMPEVDRVECRSRMDVLERTVPAELDADVNNDVGRVSPPSPYRRPPPPGCCPDLESLHDITNSSSSSSQNNPSTSRKDPSTSQNNPSTSQNNPSTSHNDPNSSQNNPSSSQNNPGSSQNNPSTSQNNPSTSQNIPSSSQHDSNPFSSQDASAAVQNFSNTTNFNANNNSNDNSNEDHINLILRPRNNLLQNNITSHPNSFLADKVTNCQAGDRSSTFDTASSTSRLHILKRAAIQSVTNSNFAGSSHSNFGEPSSSNFAGPSNSNFAGPSNSNFAGPSNSNFAEPSTSNFAGPSNSNFTGPSISNFAGPSTSNLAGPSNSNIAGSSGFAASPNSSFVPFCSSFLFPPTHFSRNRRAAGEGTSDDVTFISQESEPHFVGANVTVVVDDPTQDIGNLASLIGNFTPGAAKSSKKSPPSGASSCSSSSGGNVEISCPICFDSLSDIKSSGGHLMSTVCGHLFCFTCLDAAVRRTKQCPTCRRKLTKRNFHKLYL